MYYYEQIYVLSTLLEHVGWVSRLGVESECKAGSLRCHWKGSGWELDSLLNWMQTGFNFTAFCAYPTCSIQYRHFTSSSHKDTTSPSAYNKSIESIKTYSIMGKTLPCRGMTPNWHIIEDTMHPDAHWHPVSSGGFRDDHQASTQSTGCTILFKIWYATHL